MIRRGYNKIEISDREDENVFWVTMTDLFLGLAMVFMTLFVLAMTGFTQNKIQQQATQSEVAKKLIANMKEQKIDAVLIK